MTFVFTKEKPKSAAEINTELHATLADLERLNEVVYDFTYVYPHRNYSALADAGLVEIRDTDLGCRFKRARVTVAGKEELGVYQQRRRRRRRSH